MRDNETIKVEYGIPIPWGRPGRITEKYKWKEMEVDGSFLVYWPRARGSFSGVGCANRRLKPKRFLYRRVDDDRIRVWRYE